MENSSKVGNGFLSCESLIQWTNIIQQLMPYFMQVLFLHLGLSEKEASINVGKISKELMEHKSSDKS